MFVLGAAIGLLLLPVLARLFKSLIVQVQEREAVLVTRFGKHELTLDRPGMHFLPAIALPWVQAIPVSLRRDFRLFRGVHVNDARGTTVIVDLWVEFRIVDAARATFSVSDWDRSLQNLVAHSATSILGNREFNEILCDRNDLGRLLQVDIAEETERWGLAVDQVYIHKINLLPDVSRQIFETIAGITIAKNFRREATVYDEFSAVNGRAYGINLRRGFVLATVFPALNLLIGGGVGVLMYAGAVSVLDGAIAIGAWFLFLQSIDAFWFPLMNLSAFWSQFQAGLAAIERVFALIDAVPAVVQRASDPVGRVAGDIRFAHVGFRYAESAGAVLPDLSLHIRPGESVALVGHTGSGKSSIAKLVARFYEYQSGQILIDDRDIRTLELAAYRRHLGIVPQVPFLFSGTVADNIRYARPEATDAEIEALAHRIGGGEWLRALPDGL
ncbi:MAG: ATP-binding cassette domain-containing protein, partial [Anaerolineales bacterium]|nr:ATP-binding cassette domain-containing protein [Anaerolineales bacterium]